MKRPLAVLAALAGLLGIVSCSSGPAPGTERNPQSSAAATSTTVQVSYAGEDGRTALELLVDHADDVGVVGSGANAFVTAINGVAADESKSEFWALYVDGTAAATGAGSLETETGQTIVWVLETF